MKVTYDTDTDTLTLVFRDASVVDSDEEKTGIILDFDAHGEVIAIEILDASTRVENPGQVDFVQVA